MRRETDPAGLELTALVKQAADGNERAAENLMNAIYGDLRRIAGAVARGQRPGHTLEPTALIGEAWLKVAPALDRVEDRVHFFALAARAMRQILADHARAAHREKRGGGAHRVTLVDAHGSGPGAEVDLVLLHDSLEKLHALSERQARVVELRFLGALTVEETATVLGVSPRTVKTDWSMARAWLLRELGEA